MSNYYKLTITGSNIPDTLNVSELNQELKLLNNQIYCWYDPSKNFIDQTLYIEGINNSFEEESILNVITSHSGTIESLGTEEETLQVCNFFQTDLKKQSENALKLINGGVVVGKLKYKRIKEGFIYGKINNHNIKEISFKLVDKSLNILAESNYSDFELNDDNSFLLKPEIKVNNFMEKIFPVELLCNYKLKKDEPVKLTIYSVGFNMFLN